MVLILLSDLPSNHYKFVLLTIKRGIIHNLLTFFNIFPRFFKFINVNLILFKRFKLAKIYLEEIVLQVDIL